MYQIRANQWLSLAPSSCLSKQSLMASEWILEHTCQVAQHSPAGHQHCNRTHRDLKLLEKSMKNLEKFWELQLPWYCACPPVPPGKQGWKQNSTWTELTESIWISIIYIVLSVCSDCSGCSDCSDLSACPCPRGRSPQGNLPRKRAERAESLLPHLQYLTITSGFVIDSIGVQEPRFWTYQRVHSETLRPSQTKYESIMATVQGHLDRLWLLGFEAKDLRQTDSSFQSSAGFLFLFFSTSLWGPMRASSLKSFDDRFRLSENARDQGCLSPHQCTVPLLGWHIALAWSMAANCLQHGHGMNVSHKRPTLLLLLVLLLLFLLLLLLLL